MSQCGPQDGWPGVRHVPEGGGADAAVGPGVRALRPAPALPHRQEDRSPQAAPRTRPATPEESKSTRIPILHLVSQIAQT